MATPSAKTAPSALADAGTWLHGVEQVGREGEHLTGLTRNPRTRTPG